MVLNLRLDSDETRLLGIETHVCELQLLLSALEPPASVARLLPLLHERNTQTRQCLWALREQNCKELART